MISMVGPIYARHNLVIDINRDLPLKSLGPNMILMLTYIKTINYLYQKLNRVERISTV